METSAAVCLFVRWLANFGCLCPRLVTCLFWVSMSRRVVCLFWLSMSPTRLLLLLADYVPDPRLKVDSTSIMLCLQHRKICTKTSENMYKSINCLSKMDPWEPPGPLWGQGVSQETPRVAFLRILMHFWSLFRVPREPFWGSCWYMFCEMGLFSTVF